MIVKRKFSHLYFILVKMFRMNIYKMIEGEIIGKTPIGQTTIYLLRMNTLSRVEQRHLMIELGDWDDFP